MYSTPATGGGPSANDLEEYLLGKKRVDQMLTGDEAAKVGASHKNFIAVQNANTVRDTAAKIREDPMFAIKQQEQAEYAALMTNPLRLRALKERAGIVEDKAKDKEERKRLKKEKKKERRRRDERSLSPRSRRRDGDHGRRNTYPSDNQSLSSERERSPRRSSRYDDSPPRRSRYDSPPRRRHYDDSPPRYRRSDDTPPRDRSRSRSPIGRGRSGSGSGRRSRSPDYSYPRRARSRSPPTHRHRSPPPRRPSPPRAQLQPSAEERAARLAAMSANATSMQSERDVRLAEIKKLEEAEAAKEEAARMRASKEGGKGAFMREQERALYGGGGGGMDLAERLRRGRKDLVRERE
ncbi:RNA-splicing factor [Ceratobasidium sp. 394]|nr:RNA-splicing factor [Ceratobasidium sp. 394]